MVDPRPACRAAGPSSGVGAGHVEGEFDLLGLDFADRGTLLDEAIDAVRAAFADEFPVAKGPQWPFEGCGQRPRPVQAGGPPIWVGGSSKPALRRAAERGDGWLPQGPVTPEAVDFIRSHRRRGARRRPDRHRRHRRAGLRGRARTGTPGPCLSGPPEKLAHVLRKYSALGVGQVQVRLRSRSVDELLEQIERFGDEVGPALSG